MIHSVPLAHFADCCIRRAFNHKTDPLQEPVIHRPVKNPNHFDSSAEERTGALVASGMRGASGA